MKLCHRIGATVLCAVLLLCASCTPVAEVTPSPTPTLEATPTPTATPTPPSEPTPTPAPAVTDLVDEMLAGADVLGAEFFGVFSGSGPLALTLDTEEYGDAIRELLGDIDWQEGEGTTREEADGLYVRFGWSSYIFTACTWSNSLNCEYQDGSGQTLAYHAEGAEGLSRALAELWPAPEVRYALVTAENRETLRNVAENYAQVFERSYLDSGHITDFRLDSVQYLKQLSEEYGGVYFDFSYAVKPADPTLSAWTEGWGAKPSTVDSTGWVTYQCRIWLMPREGDRWGLYDFSYR